MAIYQIDCTPEGEIQTKIVGEHEFLPRAMLIKLPGSDDEVAITTDFVRNTYNRVFLESEKNNGQTRSHDRGL